MKITIAQIEGTPEECQKLIDLVKIDSLEELTKIIQKGIQDGKVSLG